MTIKLDKIDFEKNSNCNMSVLNQSDLNVSNLIGRNQSQASFYQNSNMLGNISNSKKVKFNEFKANFLKLRQTKKIESLSRKRNNQPKLLLNNQNIHNSNRRLMLKVKSIKQVDNNTQKININIKRKAWGSSLNKTNDWINYSYNGQLIYKTIEHNDKAMMEEFTDAIIPEFTLGPECFKIEERPKPQSVNKMGFYEDWKIIEEVISPIKNNADVNKSIQVYGFNIRKCSNNAALIDTSNFLETMGSGVKSDSKADEEFYQNYDLLSESKNDKEDSAQKYIDLVDSFRSLNKDKSIETPSFKEREGNKELNKKYEVKNIQGLKGIFHHSQVFVFISYTYLI